MDRVHAAFYDLYDAAETAGAAGLTAGRGTVTGALAFGGAESLRMAEDWLAARDAAKAAAFARQGAATLVDACLAADGTSQALPLAHAAQLALRAVAGIDELITHAP